MRSRARCKSLRTINALEHWQIPVQPKPDGVRKPMKPILKDEISSGLLKGDVQLFAAVSLFCSRLSLCPTARSLSFRDEAKTPCMTLKIVYRDSWSVVNKIQPSGLSVSLRKPAYLCLILSLSRIFSAVLARLSVAGFSTAPARLGERFLLQDTTEIPPCYMLADV